MFTIFRLYSLLILFKSCNSLFNDLIVVFVSDDEEVEYCCFVLLYRFYPGIRVASTVERVEEVFPSAFLVLISIFIN
jgi:hypothetical protein